MITTNKIYLLLYLKIKQEKLHKSKRVNFMKKKNNKIYLLSKLMKIKRIYIYLYKKMSLKIMKILMLKKYLKMYNIKIN